MTHSDQSSISRRTFAKRTVQAAGLAGMAGSGLLPLAASGTATAAKANEPLFRISLAQWSLHRSLGRGGKKTMDNLDFAKVAKGMGIEGLEYVNQFFMDKAKDAKYIAEMKKRADGEGVISLLIMCDREGMLGDPDKAKRKQAVENHYKWAEAAKTLGCHSIRVNAGSRGTYEEQQTLAADGLNKLSQFCDKLGLYCIVENHGGLSSHGRWLLGVMQLADHPRVGTLPDFGNFRIKGASRDKLGYDLWYDRYLGVEELMPYARAVSAKSHNFDASGNDTTTDFLKMMKIVMKNAPKQWNELGNYVGIEWEGGSKPEKEGIMLTKKLLESVRTKLS
jgi:L-ribulose-5-phosphate 3-epimerase